ncbi:hypothetical protein ABFS82_08G164400 [Erythranthe guttata]|uniref:UBZ4-type domain-containing protein n=1 Tax=Erythranthe guttata TaxID=4155 RepID=A0A022R2B1_ERYGU|nr:PREDICTED: uncharacterized protein LOC105962114 [Erythranthe guttata]XP_012841850.1 PREDICTED: uncharacterized protein LOC105962114 [Erythranthe guttata]EYU33753.1 hypothetical protein MIMGU_mgv1a001706mg [Erythranthe guttata]|eukprot:XP_012841849.1 PREDICTED: uncharacterized protein LOC105962114 [Erythranthe guttata]
MLSSDERVSACNNQHQFEVDLFNPLPKFSIRDYVSSTRDEDIETHWPFSSKSLHLCLNHGVKDVLPPFQTIESVRNIPLKFDSVDVVGRKLDSDIENSQSSLFLEDKEYPLPTNTVEINTKNPVKKCRLTVQSSNFSEPKSKEDTIIMTTMASKVCPVCKKFTSSSNTTLNAHIDRCLSEESKVEHTADSRVMVKHRMKPRKTKLMVDIYATSLSSTLEDLDRRNGTKWTSSNLDFSAHHEEKNDAVYYDSNGTKLRILSKFVERDRKESKLVSTKKNKYLARRNTIPKVNVNGEERKYPSEDDEDSAKQPRKVEHQLESNDFGMIKQWVGSTKRTGLKKKINPEQENQHRDIIMKDLQANYRLPSVVDKLNKRTSDSSLSSRHNKKIRSTISPRIVNSERRQHYTSASGDVAAEEPVKNAAQMEKASSSSSHRVEKNVDHGPAGTSTVVLDHAIKEVENRDEFVCGPINPNNNIGFGESLISSGFLVINGDEEGQGNYNFAEVDPIPIPGPPGSFLPSPERIPSTVLQANSSSLTTCRVHSFENEHELVERDSSDSPISAVSNSVPQESKLDDESSSSRANSVFHETNSKNGQPCCSSRKEGVLVTDQYSPSSGSTCNPVLRLMGKNLMVVNKQENISPPQIEYRPHNHHPQTRKHDVQHFDYCTSFEYGSRVHTNFGTPEYSPHEHPSRTMLSSKSFGGGSNYDFTPDRRIGTPIRYEVAGNESRNTVNNTFFSYQNRSCDYPIHSGSRIFRNANEQRPPFEVNWNRT